jgi:hypothetical protein
VITSIPKTFWVGQGAFVYRTTDQVFPGATLVPVQMSGATWDTAGFFNIGSPTKLTVTEAGFYCLSTYVITAKHVSASTGETLARIGLNGGASIAQLSQYIQSGGQSHYWALSQVWYANAGDYFEVYVYAAPERKITLCYFYLNQL